MANLCPTMRYLWLFLAYLLLLGCQRAALGTYTDSCTLYHRPAVVLTLHPDHTFAYRFQYVDTLITGTWRQMHDTLTLRSAFFLRPQRPLTPVVKYTAQLGLDRFAKRGKRLVPLTDTIDPVKGCFLQRR
ncbi:hypothetical protein D0T11_15840 [Hymenobacter rubripertinctus]|uniref:Uncharacterized protein n=1 Tax=Hymenobacter rubripertinctus TaxID=2029981 RepID=A0A418QRH3_9BACT|nr:hypothetical protein D0T11_15840 [Hymenobacter rubripertinctus]